MQMGTWERKLEGMGDTAKFWRENKIFREVLYNCISVKEKGNAEVFDMKCLMWYKEK